MTSTSPESYGDEKRTALIVGVSGQDGAYLSKLLLDRGYEVDGTSRDAQASIFSNLTRLGIIGGDGRSAHGGRTDSFAREGG